MRIFGREFVFPAGTLADLGRLMVWGLFAPAIGPIAGHLRKLKWGLNGTNLYRLPLTFGPRALLLTTANSA